MEEEVENDSEFMSGVVELRGYPPHKLLAG
jgi:hypothetical protein